MSHITELDADSFVAVSRPTISVVVPAMNEAANIAHVLQRLPDGIDEVILVDGHSTDHTVAIAQAVRPGIRVIQQSGRGKGDGLACGFASATGDIIVTIDADGSMDPQEISTLVATMLEEESDFVKGSRRLQGGGSADLTRVRTVGNYLLRLLVNWLYGTRYTDLCYGLTAFWRAHLPALGFAPGSAHERLSHHLGSGFEIETCLNIRAARSGLKVREVPSFEHPRLNGTSNLRVVRDGLRVLRSIVREKRQPVVRNDGYAAGGLADLWASAEL